MSYRSIGGNDSPPRDNFSVNSDSGRDSGGLSSQTIPSFCAT